MEADQQTQASTSAPIVKRWLFQVDRLEYYVYCSNCFFDAGDQFTGFSGSDFSREEKLQADAAALEHFQTATECDRCKTALTLDYPGIHSGCPMQDECAKVPDNPYHYYPGDCKRWKECEFVYSGCRQGSRDAEPFD
jgi:hypothetical protein